jgi:hypothetical protein
MQVMQAFCAVMQLSSNAVLRYGVQVDSRFFISTRSNVDLGYSKIFDGKYVAFGLVIEGMDVVDRLNNLETKQGIFDKGIKSGRSLARSLARALYLSLALSLALALSRSLPLFSLSPYLSISVSVCLSVCLSLIYIHTHSLLQAEGRDRDSQVRSAARAARSPLCCLLLLLCHYLRRQACL